MCQASDNAENETERGFLGRRHFMKSAAQLGLTAAGIHLIHSLPALTALEALDPAATYSQQEIDRLLKELKNAVDEYNRKLEDMEDDDEVLNDQGNENVYLRLTHPAGPSPRVFQTGWLFGAECLFKPANEDDEPIDASPQVEWGGTGSFSPAKGSSSRPGFHSPGRNTLVLSVNYKGQKITRTVYLDVVSPMGYAHMTSLVFCPADSHGCVACPHQVKGHIEKGSPQILANGKPAARLGDPGIHASCCGKNTFVVASGDPNVLINGKPAARSGDKTIHCGGIGKIV